MKWTKEETHGFAFDGRSLVAVKRITYTSDQGHIIKKDPMDGWFYGRHWFSRLKDAKGFVEHETDI